MSYKLNFKFGELDKLNCKFGELDKFNCKFGISSMSWIS